MQPASHIENSTFGILDQSIIFEVYTGDDGKTEEQNINVIRFNTHYRFYGVWVSPKDTLAYLRDHNYMVLAGNLHQLIRWFKFFDLKDLRLLCRSHGLHPAQLTKAGLGHLMSDHRCIERCHRLVYIFKCMPRHRPHVLNRFTDISVVSQSVIAETFDNQYSNMVEPVENDSEADPMAITVQAAPTTNGHLSVIDRTVKLGIIKEWQEHMSTNKLALVVCAVCSIRVSKSDSQWVSGGTVSLEVLRNIYLPREALPKTYNLMAYKDAILNPKGLRCIDHLDDIRMCGSCHRSLKASKMPKFALSNWLYYGQESLPEGVKNAFTNSSIFERMLIGRARSNSVTCRFNTRHESDDSTGKDTTSTLDKARRGIRGNVLVAPLDTIKMNEIIPPSYDRIRDTMCAVFIGGVVPTRKSLQHYTPVLVRKSRVKVMIEFLLGNNPHYKLSDSFKYSEENLNNLSNEDTVDVIPSAVHIGYMSGNDAIDSTVADYTLRNISDDKFEHDCEELLMDNVGYTDGDNTPAAYLQMKTVAVERCLQGKLFVASGTGSQIVPDFRNPSVLTWLFPHLDPWGVGGFYHPMRQVPIGMEEQLRHLLMVDNSPFENDPEFAFVFHNICRKSLVSHSLRFSVPLHTHRKIVRDLLSIDPEILTQLTDVCQKDPYYRPSPGKEQDAFKLLSSIRMISKHVPGSDGYKTMMRNEIRAVMNYRGAPTLFVTLNPSDVDNPIVRLLTGEDIILEDATRGEDLSKWQRSLLAAKNPSACARFFDLMISNFIKIILRYGRDGIGLFGKCESYYGTVEAQGKGTLHCHMLVWLKGHLSPQSLRDQMVASDDYKTKFIAWLESIVLCQFPDSTGVESQLQLHPRRVVHTVDGNPHPGVVHVPLVTDFENPNEFWKEFENCVTSLLYHYSWHDHTATCWKYLERGQEKTDENCRMGINGETREISEMDTETSEIYLRRHHPRLAAYTDVVLFLMQCNMDTKFVGSGEAAKSFTYYVTDYITKSSLTVHVGMAALSYAVTKARSRVPDDLNDVSDSQAIGAVTIAINSMMGRQEISHPQVMSYLVGGGDHYTPDKFAVLQWGSIRRECPLIPVSLENSMPEAASVSLTFGARTITASNQKLDYCMRSTDVQFDNLCLYDFVAKTSKSQIKTDTDITQNVPGSFSDESHPQYHTHRLRLSREYRIPVILGPSIPNPSKSPESTEEWARDMLLLFKPWRNMEDLKMSNESWIESYDRLEPDLSNDQRRIISNMHVTAECSDARDRHRQKRRGKMTDDMISDDGVNAILRNVESGPDAVEILEGCYGYNPFEDVDIGDEIDAIDQRVGFIVDDGTIRFLDMCLPIKMENLVEEPHRLPSRVDQEDQSLINDHLLLMTNKRKRKRADVPENENGSGVPALGPEDSQPISACVTLGYGESYSRQVARDDMTAHSVISEMGLRDNSEQLRAFEIVSRHLINRVDDQLLLHVSGVGGTGKSHVIKAIVLLFERLGRRSELLLGAPTGIAAVLINGQTLHSLIMTTPVGKSNNISSLVNIWKDVRFLIVDEVSMVGARFLSQFSSRIRVAKGDNTFGRDKPFGGVNVIFMGDFGQLKPPKQYALYSNELVKNPSFEESRNEKGISALNGVFLWRQVNAVVELIKNQRHSDDPVYAAFLGRLRTGQCFSGISDKNAISDLDYLKTRLMENQASNVHVMEEFKDAPIIVGSKTVRDLLNVRLVKYHAKRTKSNIFTYFSRDTLSKSPVTGRTRDLLWGLPSSLNREAFGRLPLFIGMKVMVTENLAFDNGIVNGSEGIVTDIKFEQDNDGRHYAKVVYVKISGCGIKLEGLADDVVPIFPVVTRIEHKSVILTRTKSGTFSRKQIPLVPAYAYTDYKSQGRTLTRVIVDLTTARGQGVYVMLSRVKSLTGLLILRWFPPSKIYSRLPEELRNELKRLNEISKLSSA